MATMPAAMKFTWSLGHPPQDAARGARPALPPRRVRRAGPASARTDDTNSRPLGAAPHVGVNVGSRPFHGCKRGAAASGCGTPRSSAVRWRRPPPSRRRGTPALRRSLPVRAVIRCPRGLCGPALPDYASALRPR